MIEFGNDRLAKACMPELFEALRRNHNTMNGLRQRISGENGTTGIEQPLGE
jgi:hypothetical protein